MKAITAWLQDKKNLPIVAIGLGVVLVGAALFFLKITGTIGGGGDHGEYDYTSMDGMPQPHDPGMPPQPGVDPGMGQPHMGGMPMDPGMAQPPPADPGQAIQVAAVPMLPYRKDPFAFQGSVPTVKDVIAFSLPSISRPRIAPAPVSERPEIAQAEVILPQPHRRMSGIMFNGRVSAILETNGETDIVRPGMEITRGNSKVRIESIYQDRIVLKTLDTKTPMTIEVKMAGSSAGPTVQGVTRSEYDEQHWPM